jgi:hypothetical protein
MTGALIEAALRSLMLAAVVWAGLRVFRIHNVLAQKAAWTIVLAGALLMPLVLPLAAHWAGLPAATVVLPWRFPAPKVVIPPAAPQQLQRAAATSPAVSAPVASLPAAQFPATSRMETTPEPVIPLSGRFPAPVISQNEFDAAPAPPASLPLPARPSFSLWDGAWFLYCVLASALLLRLLYGLGAALLLVRASKSATLESPGLDDPALTAGLDVRTSATIASPVTIGSTVLLPADYVHWDTEKLRIVLAHERSHIRQGDFYLQILSGIYAALVWFSPLGWWLKRKLSDLGEAIGDRDGLEEAASRAAYAQILLEFAAAPRPTLSPSFIGVAMARPSSLSRRVERLLNDRAFRHAFSGGRRTLLAMLLVPGVLFFATALVRVQAATQTAPQTPTPAPVTGQSHPDAAPITVAPDPEQTSPQNQPAPAPSAAPGSPVHVQVPPIHVDVPAVHVNVPAEHVEIPAINVDMPAAHIDVPAVHVNVPAIQFDVPSNVVNVPAVHVDVPAVHVNAPAVHIDVPAIHVDVPAAGAPPDPPDPPARRSSYGPTGELYAMLSGIGRVFVQAAPSPTQATFDRTLSISGQLDLSVITGSGNIHLTRGSDNQVRIHGRVSSNRDENADLVRQIASEPPIQQTGNVVHIGEHHDNNWRNIRIDYDIEAPANAMLKATSGSGNVTDQGVGQSAKLTTGSGNITATGLEGGFNTQTGSGNIVVNNTGSGDAKAQTGSGNIDVQGVHGSLNAQTGSGDIKAAGTPSVDWRLQTGSGNIELSTANAPLTLDASTGSGSISTAQEMTMQVSSDHHHVHGALNGGGPTVRAETGSGNIHVQ